MKSNMVLGRSWCRSHRCMGCLHVGKLDGSGSVWTVTFMVKPVEPVHFSTESRNIAPPSASIYGVKHCMFLYKSQLRSRPTMLIDMTHIIPIFYATPKRLAKTRHIQHSQTGYHSQKCKLLSRNNRWISGSSRPKTFCWSFNTPLLECDCSRATSSLNSTDFPNSVHSWGPSALCKPP